MALTILDPTVAANVAAATTQEAQRAALIAPWAGGDVTVRALNGAVLRDVGTYGPWVLNSATPRGMTLGSLIARTVSSTGAPTVFTFRAGSTDIFSLTAAVSPASADLVMPAAGGGVTATARTNLSDPVLGRVTISANPALPVTGSVATAFSLSVPSTGTNGTPVTVTVTPNGPIPSGGVSVTLAASNGGVLGSTSLAFTSGSTASQTTTLTRSTSGTSVVTMSNSGGLVNNGSPASFTSSAVAIAAGDRTTQPYLFQSVRQPYASTLGGSAFATDVQGPNHVYVDGYGGWRWTNTGGDWIDATGAAQGASDFASAAVDTGAVGDWTTYPAIAVTALVQYAQVNNRHMAVHLRRTGGARTLATNWHATQPAPLISVTYADATTGTLACRIVALADGSTSFVRSTQDVQPIGPLLLEFERPTKAVASATLRLAVRKDASGTATLALNLCNPPLNADPVTNASGLAASAGPLDEGITSVPGVIGAQRYVDGSALTDFAIAAGAQPSGPVSSESSYDPALWGGTTDLAKYPHTVVGKWVNTPAGLSLVDSSYSGEGFQPLADGLGALKVVMPVEANTNGQAWPEYRGTKAIDARLYMPIEQMGLLPRIFVRQYVRLGTPYLRTPANRLEVVRGGAPLWTDMGGKLGVAPAHETSYGGVSGSSGGGYGWQMRWAWNDCDANLGGPDEQGLTPGWHLYDFGANNPPAYRYGGESQPVNNWGQRGGLGAMMYAGRWYEVETEVKLNTVNPADNSYLADGELRTWIDGRLVYERTGMVFRTLPLYDPGYNAGAVRPFRELGVGWLWWNWFNGGLSPNTVERTMFVTGLVYGTSRIGKMQTPPAWAATQASQTWGVVPMGNTLDSIDPKNNAALNPNGAGNLPPWQLGLNDWPKTVTAWNGAYFDDATSTFWRAFVGGHGDGGSNSVEYASMADASPQWVMLRAPTGSLTVGAGVNPDDGQEATGVYADGRPRSVHSYNSPVWTPSGMFHVGQSAYFRTSGYGGRIVYTDPATGESLLIDASSLVPNNSAVDGGGGCFDPTRGPNGSVWWLPGDARMVRYQLPASGPMNGGTLSQIAALTGLGTGYKSICYIPGHDVILIARSPFGHGSTNWLVLDCATGTYSTPTVTGSVAGLLDAGSSQLRWVESLGAVCFWNQSSNTTLIARMTPGANPRTIWTLDTLPVSGANAVTPTAATPNGTFGRFAFAPGLGGFLVFNATGGSMYFYKI